MAFDATDFQISSQSQSSAGLPAPVTSAAVDPLTLTTPRERLEYMRDLIARLPRERFNMAYYAGRGREGPAWDGTDAETLKADCGTAACICGWANALFTGQPLDSTTAAGEALGLPWDQYDALFHPDIDIIGEQWDAITNAEAVAVLDHLLRTGEVDWSVARSGQ